MKSGITEEGARAGGLKLADNINIINGGSRVINNKEVIGGPAI